MSSASPLASFTPCEISDALVKLGVVHGGHIPDIHPLAPSPTASICGQAYTVQMVLASTPESEAPKLDGHFVDMAPEGSVFVIDAPKGTPNAVWGGLMTAGALARSAIGVIISGRCRDVAEHREMGFPVFARGRSTLGQATFVRAASVNTTLTIEGVSVRPGDWMVADEDGVVCVPVEMVDRVVEMAGRGREVDARCMRDIREGKGVQVSFKEHRGK